MRFHGPVNILGRMVRVEYVPDLKDGDEELYGQILHPDDVIKLNQDFEGTTRLEETILHEIIHGISGALGMGLEEQNVTSLARGLWVAGVRYGEPQGDHKEEA